MLDWPGPQGRGASSKHADLGQAAESKDTSCSACGKGAVRRRTAGTARAKGAAKFLWRKTLSTMILCLVAGNHLGGGAVRVCNSSVRKCCQESAPADVYLIRNPHDPATRLACMDKGTKVAHRSNPCTC